MIFQFALCAGVHLRTLRPVQQLGFGILPLFAESILLLLNTLDRFDLNNKSVLCHGVPFDGLVGQPELPFAGNRAPKELDQFEVIDLDCQLSLSWRKMFEE